MPQNPGPTDRQEKSRSISIPVKPAVLVWARESMGRTVKEAAAILGESEEQVLQWEAGQKQPTLHQVKALARFYKRPLAVFFLTAPPEELSLPHEPDMPIKIEELLKSKRREILAIAAKHGAHNLRVFGSVARGEAGPESDLDILVEMEPGKSLLDHVALMHDLEDLLQRKVDVVSERALHWYIRDRVLAEATPL